MAVAITQSFTNTFDGPTTSITTSSWTPQANELLLCIIGFRAAGSGGSEQWVTGVSGNGLTWEHVEDINDTQNTVHAIVFRAMGPAPTAGGVTITLGLSPIALGVHMVRLTGVDTSGAIGATATAQAGATDSTPATVSLTTTRANSRVFGFVSGRTQTQTAAADFTGLHMNVIAFTSNQSRTSSQYKDVATAGTLTTPSFSLSAAGDWAILGFEVLQATSTTHALTATGIAAGGRVGTPNVAQRHALTAQGISTTPVLAKPSITQRHALAAQGITATPVLGQPQARQAHALSATGITATPTLGQPSISVEGIDNVTAQGITAAPSLGKPVVGQRHALGATGINATPTLGQPQAGQVYALSAAGLTATPSLGNPFVGQRHRLGAQGITATPTLGTPSLTAPTVAQAQGISATPILGRPVLDFVAPPLRIYVVPFENRFYVVPFENRVYEV